MKSKNDITSHENVLEAMEQSCTESNCKGEEHPEGSHPVFPTRTLPSAKRVKLAPPLGGNKADSLHAALPRQRKPVFNPFSSPMSNSRAQRLGAGAGTEEPLWVTAQPVTAPHSTGSRRRSSRSSTWAVLSWVPDPSCPEQNGQ